MSFDAIVVGCGVAGLSAAVAAPESGAKVAVLERSTFEERGGNTRYTTAAVRMKNEDAVADDFEQRFTDNSGYHVSPDLIEATVLDYDNWPGLVRTAPFTGPDLIAFFAEQAPLTIAWLKSRGVHFGGIGFYGLTPRSSPRIAITGGGLHLVEGDDRVRRRAGRWVLLSDLPTRADPRRDRCSRACAGRQATDGDPIPGLYAAGETVGIYYGRYPGATSVLRGAVFGRQAGASAAAAARRSQH